jgi:opacity protein-like surface antigen
MSITPLVRAAMLLATSASALLSVSPSALVAQDSTGTCCIIRREHQPSEFERRSAGSLNFIQSRPSGALANNIGFGYGVNAAYLFRLDRQGYFALRLDGGYLQYGSESKRVPLSSTIGGRIQVDVSTENNIVPVTIGLQAMAPRGPVRPYANAGVGGQFFFTQSHVEGADDQLEFARTTNQWDKTGVWVAGGGVYIPVYERKTKVAIDLGAQYVGGGRARYLRPGSIQDQPDGSLRINGFESETNMVMVRLGVRVGL